MKSFIIAIAALASTTSAWPTRPSITTRQTVCNTNSAFCERKYSDVHLIGTHDSAFIGTLLDPTVNQQKSVPEQLDAGIRFLQAQSHDKDGNIQLCHTSCDLHDAGTLQDYLSIVNEWLDGHTTDVVTILLTNGDGIDIAKFGDVFARSGIKDYAFVPATSPDLLAVGDWPTLQEMIDDGKRLVVFMDSDADETKVDFILPEWNYFWETAYDVTEKQDFLNCSIDRPAGSAADGKMSIVNHFLDMNVFGTGVLVPNNMETDDTNAASGEGSIGENVDACKAMYDGAVPNVVLVDFFDRGDVFTAQRAMNGL